MRRLVLADFSWLCYRYFFAHKDMAKQVEDKVVPIGLFFGFGQLLKSIYKSNTNTDVVFCLDEDQEKLNSQPLHQDAYKAGREYHPEVWEFQQEVIGTISCCSRAAFARSPGIEADDVMAVMYFDHKDAYDEIVIFSGDNDLLQLIPYGVKVSRKFGKGNFIFLGDEYFQEKFPGVPIEHLIKYRILVGDPSDNIPPVVPRLNREWIKQFIKVWHEKGLKGALSLYADDKNLRKVLLNRDGFKRNALLMDLTKYASPALRMRENEEKNGLTSIIDLFKCPPRQDLVERYSLGQYEEFLTLFNRIMEYDNKGSANTQTVDGGQISTTERSSSTVLRDGEREVLRSGD